MPRRFWLAAFASVSACSLGGPTEPAASVEGTYGLARVNGSSVPATVEARPDYLLRITDGNFVINIGNTFSTATTFQEMEAGQTTTTTETCTGTYTRSGFLLAFSESLSGQACGRSYTGGWNGGDTVTVVYDASLRAVYTR